LTGIKANPSGMEEALGYGQIVGLSEIKEDRNG